MPSKQFFSPPSRSWDLIFQFYLIDVTDRRDKHDGRTGWTEVTDVRDGQTWQTDVVDRRDGGEKAWDGEKALQQGRPHRPGPARRAGGAMNFELSRLSNNQLDDIYWRATNHRRDILLIKKNHWICCQKVHFDCTSNFLKRCQHCSLFALFITSANEYFEIVRVRTCCSHFRECNQS